MKGAWVASGLLRFVVNSFLFFRAGLPFLNILFSKIIQLYYISSTNFVDDL